MDKEMMEALAKDAAMLEEMGAGEQLLAFEGHAVGMRLTNGTKGLWEVYDRHGNILGKDLSLSEAD